MFTDFAWAAPPLTLVPVCLRKPPSPPFLVIKHWGQEEMVPRWQNTAIWSGAVVIIIIIIIIIIIFRQALPIQLQNTSASPCRGRAGLWETALPLCWNRCTKQNRNRTKTSNNKQMKRLNVGSFRGWHEDKVWTLSRSAIASTEGYFCVPFFLGNGASPIAPSFLVHAACW